MNFITAKKQDLFNHFITDYKTLFDVDENLAKTLLKNGELFKRLTEEWYHQLENGTPQDAYRVYDDEYYFVDIFNCYATYSRDYIKRIIKSPTALALLKDSKSFVDIGCGISYSTCALKQVFPNAKAYAINLRNTKQWEFCDMMSKTHHFHLIESVDEVAGEVDFVFASEYFEHIENPTRHFQEIVDKIQPKYFIIANAFNTWSIGHYKTYVYDHTTVDQSKISKLFNRYIRLNGYEKVNCNLWNNKPTIWKKV